MLYVAVFVIRQLRGPRRSAAVPVFETDRFTRLTTTGNAFLAAISPDGRYIVHVKTDGIKPGLWVRQTATTSDVQIVPPAAVRYDGVTYSPDGDYVYYVTYELAGGIGTLYKIPVLGGTPQKLVEDIDSRVSFSPDAKRLVFVRGMPTGTNTLITANADGSGPEPFGVLAAPYQMQLNGPSWSPDGKTILGSAQSLQGGPHVSVFAFDTATGASHEIGGRWPNVGDLEWMPDGEAFIMSASEFTDLTPQLRVVTYPEGERRRITNDLNNYLGVSVTANARTIATVQAERVSNIWVVPAGAGADGARQITSGRGRDDGLTGVAWTPDGRIVFSSSASGRPEIWIADRDGANQRQLTNEAGPSISPAVTPDGRFVVYQKLLLEGLYVHRMGLDGSNVVRDREGQPRGGAAHEPRQPLGVLHVAGRRFASPVQGADRRGRAGLAGRCLLQGDRRLARWHAPAGDRLGRPRAPAGSRVDAHGWRSGDVHRPSGSDRDRALGRRWIRSPTSMSTTSASTCGSVRSRVGRPRRSRDSRERTSSRSRGRSTASPSRWRAGRGRATSC